MKQFRNKSAALVIKITPKKDKALKEYLIKHEIGLTRLLEDYIDKLLLEDKE